MRLLTSLRPRVSSFSAASTVAFAVVALLLLPRPSSSQDLRGELRLQLLNTGMRWSSDIPEGAPGVDPYKARHASDGDFIVRPGIGLRLFSSEGNGAFVDVEGRVDLDRDGLFDEDGGASVNFVVGRGGYAHRFVFPLPRRPDHRAHALTLSAGVAAGFAGCDVPDTGLPRRTGVVGPSMGVDYDVHFGRLIMGWGLSGDLLVHAQGPMRLSSFLNWNFAPFFRLGAAFGPRIQVPHARRSVLPTEEAHHDP